MKIVVTGAHGFIGSHLVPKLKGRGHLVIPLDLEDGDLRGAFAEAGFEELLRRSSADTVVHLAAQVGRERGETQIEETITSNALMTARVARATRQAGARLVYCSTSEVYGDQGDRTCHEWRDMRVPHNLYGLSKRWGEEAAALYAPKGLQVVRLSMPYGPGLPAGFGRAAIINMLWQAHYRYPIPVHRNARRAWCWVGDTIDGMITVMERGERAENSMGWQNGRGVYNVGGEDEEVSMLEVAERACELAGAPTSIIELVDAPSNQTVVKRLSMAKLRGLGWSQKVPLHEGMALTYERVQHYPPEGGDHANSEAA